MIIGNVTQDIIPNGRVLGGTGAYSAITAARLGIDVGLVTRAAEELDLESLLPDVHIHKLPGTCTTTFENVYVGNTRTQWIRKVAAPMSLDDVPAAWRSAPIVHLAPIAREVPISMGEAFPEALVGATPQGWLRAWDDDGRVQYRPLPEPATALRDIDVLIFSPEDVASNAGAMAQLVDAAPLVVITRANQGCDVYIQSEHLHVPARRTTNVADPTGAGDVFAAAFLIRYRETGDALEAARFANGTASFSIEGLGTETIPQRETVTAWMQERDDVSTVHNL